MKEEDAKKTTCPLLSRVITEQPQQEHQGPVSYLWIEKCRGTECQLWESNEPIETGGKLFDNGYCGLKVNPFT